MEGTLAKDKRHVGIKIMDGDDVLYDENQSTEKDFDSDPLFTKAAAIQMHGRSWNFEILSNRSFRQATSNERPWLILVGGMIIDSMLLGLFIVLARSNRRAIQFANKMAEEYQSKANRLSNIIEHAVDGLITIDETGLVESFNPACEIIFDYKSEQAIGQNITLFVPDPYRRKNEAYLPNQQDREEKQIVGIGRKVEGRKQDGTVVPLDLSVSEIFVDGRRLYNGIIRDISEHQKAENEILRSNLELERFAYIASHDLQEPLRMVSSFTELLQEEYGDKMEAQAKLYLSYTLKSSRRMQELVSDLLEYSRVDYEESGFSSFDSKAQIDAVINNLHDAIEETKAKITIDKMPTVLANPLRFSRLMQNLIGNAIKYRRKDTVPEIQISVEEKESDWLFSVSDNGIGIKPEYLEQIFIIFKRLHSKDEYPGTGMGLAICAKIVENFAGRLWVDSEEGKGSVFYFTLPKQIKVREAA